ncbi:restriction endonuclease subunit S [uncultured Fusobacterium sp.]|uniref:restriction endonuclease subunit S n=1 Tax=uncultured Fusobacterium sp. TaxID=159267 RepID=UPI0025F3FBB7|nr:restriction endonuclease subunit S [uncultured Fusobacterium sp.]
MAKNKDLTLEEKLREALIPKEEQPYEIPESWEWVKVKTVLKVKNGIAIDSSEYGKGEIPLVRISNIQNNKIDLLETVTIKFQDKYKDYLIKNGDLLIAMSGATTGKLGIFNEDKICIQNQRIGNIKIKKGIIEDYRNYYFFKIKDDILKTAYGGAQPNISGNNIENFLFPLPPLEEQKRIVEKLEFMFEKINKAKELIQEVKENIENRKESILNKSFRGELTAEWRKNNQTEDAIELLKSINEEKIKNWEQTCIEAEKSGKKKPSKPKIEEIENMIVSKEEEPYEIPKNWKWVKLGQIIELISGQDVSNTLCNSEGRGIPYILGASNLNNEIFVAERWIEKPRVISKKDNILLSVKGTIGKIYLQKEEEINLSRQIMALKTGKNIFNKWLKYFLNNIINEIKEKGNGLIPGISREIILNIRTPLPPLKEQEEIVRILDEILEKESKIKELIELEEAIELLEKSILDKAFRGELGTQNKEDEPAIELLKKIL